MPWENCAIDPAAAFGMRVLEGIDILWESHKRFSANALPEPDLKYFSNSTALDSFEKAM
jgi:hypothetical protein